MNTYFVPPPGGIRLLEDNAGGIVKSLRISRGMTQADLALRLEVSQKTISSIERGTQGISVDKFVRLLTFLGAQAKVTDFE